MPEPASAYTDAVIVDFPDRPGLRQVALTSPDALHRSAEAVQRAMGVIEHLTNELHAAITSRENRPDRVDVAFGVKFDTEVGALVAKSGLEAAITVTLSWSRKESQ